MNTHPSQAPEGDNRRYQGRNVLAQHHGTCMHCKADITALLVNLSTGRRWVCTGTFGPRNVEHVCTRATA